MNTRWKRRLLSAVEAATRRAHRAANERERHDRASDGRMAAARQAARREAAKLPKRWRRAVELTAASLAAGDGWPVCTDDDAKRRFYRRLCDAAQGLGPGGRPA